MINRKTILSLALVFLVGTGCYLNSLGGGFTFDDIYMVENNLLIRSFGNARQIFTTPWWRGGVNKISHEYRPLTVFSFALNYRIHELSPFGYHFANVLLHILASMLLFAFLLKWTRDHRLAFISALFFAAHPVHTEAVNNIVGRAEILAALFVFAGLLFYAIGMGRQNALLLHCVSAFFFLLGLLSKETAVVFLPAAFLLFLLDRKKKGDFPLFSPLRKSENFLPFLFFSLVFAFYLFLRKIALGGFLSSSESISPMDNILAIAKENRNSAVYYATTLKALGVYFHLLLFPLDLTADYSYKEIPLATGFCQMEVIFSFLALGALCLFACFLWRKKQFSPLFGILFLLIALAPISNIFFMIGTLLGERLLYIPSAGFCAVLAWFLVQSSEKATARLKRQSISLPSGTALFAICSIVVFLYGFRCITRNPAWKDNHTLFEVTARTSPSSARAHRNLGHEFMLRGQYDEAMVHLERALEIAPFYAAALASKGEILRCMGKMEESIPLQEKALTLQPGFYLAHFYLAEALFDRAVREKNASSLEKAVEHYEITANLMPGIPGPFVKLGEIYLERLPDEGKSEYYYQKARRIAPESPLPLMGLARLSLSRNDFLEAERLLSKAEKIAPEYPAIPFYRGMSAIKRRHYPEAERYFLETLELAPNDPFSYLNLADLYAEELDQPPKAIYYYEEYLRRFPGRLQNAAIEKTLERLKQFH
ncbi:tetratricopeptide repeat protein [Candidatus Sumerlaeota bacterium]|nr:tetratricopeptide repeat protein [Candidatus Sumerlaeota bacterium]